MQSTFNYVFLNIILEDNGMSLCRGIFNALRNTYDNLPQEVKTGAEIFSTVVVNSAVAIATRVLYDNITIKTGAGPNPLDEKD